mmetsp:Transcript_2534/g.3829  ORF Transcript_2534/g.3829 Transcript_2534/m.3829 type:complete len:108 (+) Transcript_2534:869-1192(+)
MPKCAVGKEIHSYTFTAADLSEEDLALLSLATFMISEGSSFEFCMATGAVMGALDTPTGIESLDEAAFISGEWQNRSVLFQYALIIFELLPFAHLHTTHSHKLYMLS